MIDKYGTLDGAATIVRDDILMTNSEAGAYGEAVVATSGRLTKCGATAAPQYILAKDTAAGTDVKTEYIPVRKDDLWIIDVVGTAGMSAVAAAVGTKTAQLDATGLNLNSDQLTGGKVIIEKILDTNKKKVLVRFDV